MPENRKKQPHEQLVVKSYARALVYGLPRPVTRGDFVSCLASSPGRPDANHAWVRYAEQRKALAATMEECGQSLLGDAAVDARHFATLLDAVQKLYTLARCRLQPDAGVLRTTRFKRMRFHWHTSRHVCMPAHEVDGKQSSKKKTKQKRVLVVPFNVEVALLEMLYRRLLMVCGEPLAAFRVGAAHAWCRTHVDWGVWRVHVFDLFPKIDYVLTFCAMLLTVRQHACQQLSPAQQLAVFKALWWGAIQPRLNYLLDECVALLNRAQFLALSDLLLEMFLRARFTVRTADDDDRNDTGARLFPSYKKYREALRTNFGDGSLLGERYDTVQLANLRDFFSHNSAARTQPSLPSDIKEAVRFLDRLLSATERVA